MKVGNIVAYKEGTGYHLVSGGSYYPYAIVGLLEPLTLISEEGDMKWTATVEPEFLEVRGEATAEQMKPIAERMARDAGR